MKEKIKNSYMCEFGNCEVEGDLKIIITIKETFTRRTRFCSIAHAIGWLIDRKR